MKCPYCIKICSKCGKLLVANTMNFRKKKDAGRFCPVSGSVLCDERRAEICRKMRSGLFLAAFFLEDRY